jgi:4-amino-4-deoxy-L-arabinose transferase-like glycosyltransferase
MRLTGVDRVLAALVVFWAACWWLPGLAHPGTHNWDESIHQAMVRGTYETPGYPHLWADPLYPVRMSEWWATDVALHNPPMLPWLAALVMKAVGVAPWAARFVGVLGQLAAALVLYALGRRTAGRAVGLVAALSWVVLPFGWVLAQGHFFGDVMDCTLVGFVSLSAWALTRAIEEDTAETPWRGAPWAALTGALLGGAFLTKYVLGLAPLGVAGVLTVGRTARLTPGLRWRTLALLLAAFALAVTPWLAWSAHQWPEAFQLNVVDAIIGHATGAAGADVGPWRRPADGVFVELLGTEFAPLPQALTYLAGLALLVQAVRKRDAAACVVALWAWSTWVAHSFVSAKAPAHVWNAAPGAMLGFALLGYGSWRSPAVGLASVTAAAVPVWLPWLPELSRLRQAFPAGWQVRTTAGPVEGLALAVGMAGLALVLLRAGPLSRLGPPLRAAGVLAVAAALFLQLPLRNLLQRAGYETEALTAYSRELGLAADRVIPERSVLFQLFEQEPGTSFELHNSLFWTGRMTYRRPVDLETARAKGYRSYAVSSRSEPYEDVGIVPAWSWLRLYDAERPAPPAPVPAAARLPAPVALGGKTLLGLAAGPLDSDHDKYAFYLRSDAAPGATQVSFEGPSGMQKDVVVRADATLFAAQRLAGREWFILPVVGPRRSELKGLALDGVAVPLPP